MLKITFTAITCIRTAYTSIRLRLYVRTLHAVLRESHTQVIIIFVRITANRYLYINKSYASNVWHIAALSKKDRKGNGIE